MSLPRCRPKRGTPSSCGSSKSRYYAELLSSIDERFREAASFTEEDLVILEDVRNHGRKLTAETSGGVTAMPAAHGRCDPAVSHMEEEGKAESSRRENRNGRIDDPPPWGGRSRLYSEPVDDFDDGDAPMTMDG